MINPEYPEYKRAEVRERVLDLTKPFIETFMANRDAVIAGGEMLASTASHILRLPATELIGLGLHLVVAAAGTGLSYVPYLSIRFFERRDS